jgi:hypothetical protein
MDTTKVTEWVDIEAPVDEVYDTIVNCHRRLQLSPLWGLVKIEEISEEYPQSGSSYQLKKIQGEEEVYETVVTQHQPRRFLCYTVSVDRDTSVRWSFQGVQRGTRLVYEEQFLVAEEEREDFSRQVREMVRKWLTNIKRYSELREGRSKRLLKWILDRYFLRLRQDQRNVILAILSLQIISMITFFMSALALGVASMF